MIFVILIVILVSVGAIIAVTVKSLNSNSNNSESTIPQFGGGRTGISVPQNVAEEAVPTPPPTPVIPPVPLTLDQKVDLVMDDIDVDISELSTTMRANYRKIIYGLMQDDIWDSCISALPIPLTKDASKALTDLKNLPSSTTYDPLKTVALGMHVNEFMIMQNEIRITQNPGYIALSGLDIDGATFTSVEIVDHDFLIDGDKNNGVIDLTNANEFSLSVDKNGENTTVYLGGNTPITHTTTAMTAPRLYTLSGDKLMIDSVTVETAPSLIAPPITTKYGWIGAYNMVNDTFSPSKDKTTRGLFLFKDLTDAQVIKVNQIVTEFMSDTGMMDNTNIHFTMCGEIFTDLNAYLPRNFQIAMNEPSNRIIPIPRNITYVDLISQFHDRVDGSWKKNETNYFISQPKVEDFSSFVNTGSFTPFAALELYHSIEDVHNKVLSYPYNGHYMLSPMVGNLVILSLDTPDDYWLELNTLYEKMKTDTFFIDISDDNLYRPLSHYADESAYIAGCNAILSNSLYFNAGVPLAPALDIIASKIATFFNANSSSRLVPTYEEDAFDVFRKVTMTSQRDQMAYRNLIAGMKSNGSWAKGVEFYPVIATEKIEDSMKNIFDTSESLQLKSTHSSYGSSATVVPGVNQFITDDTVDYYGNYSCWGEMNKTPADYVGGSTVYELPITNSSVDTNYAFGTSDNTIYSMAARYFSGNAYYNGLAGSILTKPYIANSKSIMTYDVVYSSNIATDGAIYKDDGTSTTAHDYNAGGDNAAILNTPISWCSCYNSSAAEPKGAWRIKKRKTQGIITFDHLDDTQRSDNEALIQTWMGEMNRPSLNNSTKYNDFVMFSGSFMTRLNSRSFSRAISLQKYLRDDTYLNMENRGYSTYTWQNLMDAYNGTIKVGYDKAVLENASTATTLIAWEFANDYYDNGTNILDFGEMDTFCNEILNRCAQFVTMAKASGFQEVKICSMFSIVKPPGGTPFDVWGYGMDYINQALRDTPNTIYGTTYVLEDPRFFFFKDASYTDITYANALQAMLNDTKYYDVDKKRLTDYGSEVSSRLWAKKIYG